ncbi:hypothetical protein RDWZM_006536 [Blomia tropicalis]|uniref:Uncharacterized protein n=1 Tax=Blomia tropicalis TaxID=40697 RepID=A0A9Q0M892_BLOTA|nr:hypothetical protein RDWZM_006536 [Blomia tropicalis]
MMTTLEPISRPPSVGNMGDVMQQLLDQANQVLGQNVTNNDTNVSNANNPIVQFLTQLIQTMMQIFNQLIRIFSLGMVNSQPSLIRADVRQNDLSINDQDLKSLHAKVHGPDCDCNQFKQDNLSSNNIKRSVKETSEADESIWRHWDSLNAAKLVAQFKQSDPEKRQI